MDIDPLKIPAFMRLNQLGRKAFGRSAPMSSRSSRIAAPAVRPAVQSQVRPAVRPMPRPIIRIKQRPVTFMAPFMLEPEAAKPAQHAKSAKPKRVKPEPVLLPVGTVTHFFDKIKVAVLELKADIHVGDRLQLAGEKGPFKQTLKSMQIDRQDVPIAGLGDDVGIKVAKKVTIGEAVYRVE